MKLCSECETPNGLTELFCGACGQVLEERTYLRAISICSVLGVVLHWGLLKARIYSRFSIGEVFVTATIFLFILYPAYKLFQKWREPSRPIGQEALSVHGDRWSRVMLLVMLLLGAWFLLMPGSVSDAAREPLVLHAGFKAARIWAVRGLCIVGYGMALIIVSTQGRAFFDPRVVHAYRDRG
ncbi:MAG TPA: zinc ribbon domain-containing protein [Archangium sp.]|nr:zinc ribbon domain-containing protein [Archangium sp.]